MGSLNARQARIFETIAAQALGNSERGWKAAEFIDLADQAGVTVIAASPLLANDLANDGGSEVFDGFVILRAVLDEAEILALAVRPPRQKAGLGRALMQEAHKVAAQAGAKRIILEVSIQNDTALALYAQLGYVSIGRRPGYFHPPQGGVLDAIVMACPLA